MIPLKHIGAFRQVGDTRVIGATGIPDDWTVTETATGWVAESPVVRGGKLVWVFDSQGTQVRELPVTVASSKDAPAAVPPSEPISEEKPMSFTVVPGTKPGFVEIRFADKPSDDVLNELRGADFRWTWKNKCWYGKAERLPAQYQDAPPVTDAPSTLKVEGLAGFEARTVSPSPPVPESADPFAKIKPAKFGEHVLNESSAFISDGRVLILKTAIAEIPKTDRGVVHTNSAAKSLWDRTLEEAVYPAQLVGVVSGDELKIAVAGGRANIRNLAIYSGACNVALDAAPVKWVYQQVAFDAIFAADSPHRHVLAKKNGLPVAIIMPVKLSLSAQDAVESYTFRMERERLAKFAAEHASRPAQAAPPIAQPEPEPAPVVIPAPPAAPTPQVAQDSPAEPTAKCGKILQFPVSKLALQRRSLNDLQAAIAMFKATGLERS